MDTIPTISIVGMYLYSCISKLFDTIRPLGQTSKTLFLLRPLSLDPLKYPPKYAAINPISSSLIPQIQETLLRFL